MTDMSPADRKAALAAELAAIEAQERAEAQERLAAEQAAKAAQLDPAQKAALDELNRRGAEVLDAEPPPVWNPQKGEHPHRLIGQVMGIDLNVGPSPMGGYAHVVWLRATDGNEWRVYCNEGSILWHELIRCEVQPGDPIAVAWEGKRPSKSDPSRTVNLWKLRRLDEDERIRGKVDYGSLPAVPSNWGPHGVTGADAPNTPLDPDDDIPF